MKGGDLIIILGAALILIGVLVRYGLFSWFGNLPLDFKHKGENSFFFAPIGSMIVISIFFSAVMKLIQYFRG